ncbi:hypothetical protein CALCODRAFT_497394 [Calocera cornea HHB12733]|uniref:RlpA-like protein double-psi beta-barrel domain-containing protein n=1 Tax=Calocera cornea HHB12733 TaxID=1353952 RepID=A0A165FB08_9BASI|nr:hypothetical protein CALCODRAFT_497394 [Calocera cornea HHB12733]
MQPTILLLLLPLLALATSSPRAPLSRSEYSALGRSLSPAQRRAFEASPHSGLAKKLAAAEVEKKQLEKKALKKKKGKRCTPKNKGSSSSSSSSSSSAPTDVGAGNVAGSPTAQDPPPATQAAPTTTTTTSSAAPTTSASSSGSGSSGSDSGSGSSGSGSTDDPNGILTGTHTGQGTFYAVGLGACGVTNVPTDAIVAVSEKLFDVYPGYAGPGSNPNNNPVCGKQLKATYQGVTQTVTVQDRCTGCAMWDLDMSTGVFDKFADEALGRLNGVSWEWV